MVRAWGNIESDEVVILLPGENGTHHNTLSRFFLKSPHTPRVHFATFTVCGKASFDEKRLAPAAYIT